MAETSGGGAARRRPSDPEASQRQRRASHLADVARRRTTVLAAGGLLLVVLIAVVVGLLSSGGDDKASKRGPSAAERRVAGNRIVVPAAGIAIVRPRRWSGAGRDRAVRLRSPNGGTALTILAPPGAATQKATLDQATEVIRSGLRNVEFLPSPTGQTVAGLPARFARFKAGSVGGAKVEGLLAAVKGKEQTYLVQIVSRVGDPQRVAAQAALNTLRLVN